MKALERQYDAFERAEDSGSSLLAPDEPMPTGEEIGGMTMEVLALEPNKKVHWRFRKGPEEWIGTDAIFDLSQDGDYTIVLFGHRNWREPVEFMAHCSTKWAAFMLSLKELVETGRGKPSPNDVKIDNWN